MKNKDATGLRLSRLCWCEDFSAHLLTPDKRENHRSYFKKRGTAKEPPGFGSIIFIFSGYVEYVVQFLRT